MGAVACLLLSLAGCGGGPVEVADPHPQGEAATLCRRLVHDLPGSVADQSRRDISPEAAAAAAWGNPAIVLRCGVPKPKGYDEFATCQVTNGVGWYIPESQMTADPDEVTMTTIGRASYVEVTVPGDYLPPATAMADLAPAIKKAIPETQPCV